jgi:hypothetical protein
MGKNKLKVITIASAFSMMSFSFFSHASFAQNAIAPDATLPINTLVTHVTQKPKKVSETAIPSEIAAKP